MYLYPKIEKTIIFIKKIKQKYKVLKQICLSLGKKNNNNQKREDLKLTWCKIAIRACDCCPVR